MSKRKSTLCMVTVLLMTPFGSVTAVARPELSYSSAWCNDHSGRTEVVLDGGTRADCLTADHAVEVERAPKWYQAIGQSLWYAFQTNKRAGIVMIIGDGDRKYLYRLQSVIDHNDLPIDVYEVPE